jgi:hypothetical protein
MDNSQAVSFLVGIVIPLLISWLKSCAWPQRGKVLVALVVSVVAGAATSWAAGNLIWSWDRALVDAAIVVATGQGTYKLLLEGSGIDRRLTGS